MVPTFSRCLASIFLFSKNLYFSINATETILVKSLCFVFAQTIVRMMGLYIYIEIRNKLDIV